MVLANLSRTDCPCRLHDPVSGQQHLCQCQHAARGRSCYCSSVGILPLKANSAANLRSSGMHIIAATFLLPVGVAVYTFVGGIKAT